MNAFSLAVAAVQMSSQDDLEKNLLRVGELVKEAADRGARVIVLPEGFAHMGTDERKRAIAEELDGGATKGPIFRALAEAARASTVHLIAGGMPERSPDPERPYNTAAVIGPDGTLIARYRKLHLFDVEVGDGHRYRESSSTMAGATPIVVTVEGFRVGLSICYDLRFPELYRKLTDLGAEVIVVPSAFTLVTGKDHWHVLLRARAIEAQAYVVAAAQWGTHPAGRRTYGKTLIVDPWGDVIAQCPEGEGVATATLDRAHLERVRATLPSLRHRRLSSETGS
jgi:predicted amidohydrolase